MTTLLPVSQSGLTLPCPHCILPERAPESPPAGWLERSEGFTAPGPTGAFRCITPVEALQMDDSSERPGNPYRSPSTYPSGYEAPEPVYGLGRPICIQGTLTAEDLRPRGKRAFWEMSGVGVLGGVLLAGIVWNVAILPVYGLGGDRLLYGLVTTLSFGLFFALVVLLPLYLRRRLVKEAAKSASLEKTTITEDGIVIESERGRTVLQWPAFYKCECSDRAVQLHTHRAVDWIVVPKRFFENQDDWRTFVDLVRCKLPEDEISAQRQASVRKGLQPPEGFPVKRAAEAKEQKKPLITVKGSITLEDWKHVRRLVGARRADWTARIGCPLGILFLVLPVAWLGAGESNSLRLLYLAVFAALCIWTLFSSPTGTARRQLKRREGLFAPLEIRVSEEDVQFITPEAADTISWGAFEKSTCTHRVLLLHESRLKVFRYVPRSFFSTDEHWQELLDLVRRKLPDY